MPGKILIVDDNKVNRTILRNLLRDVYEILDAESGKDALALIHSQRDSLSAVLLDIVMPEMNGYETLQAIRSDREISDIPVIMITGYEDEEVRSRVLALGANDFITKPYDPAIIKHCLNNNIVLHETVSALNIAHKDKLTGLFNREAFFDKVNRAIHSHEAGYYLLSAFDVEKFKLINDQFGIETGDQILREIGRTVGEDMESVDGIGGRITGDNFAVLLPIRAKELSIDRIVQENRMAFSDKQGVVFSIGRYVINDLSLTPSAIYDRAYIAKQSVKGQYGRHIAYFDDTMLEKLIQAQEIVNHMDVALAERQFEVWYQPQYDHYSGKMIGAEALVRWRFPEKGLISPGVFIPIFEQNGFISELDKYVVEEVCRRLRKWLDEGREPLPVSVNISRLDILRANLVEVVCGLLKKYDLPTELLCLEITESAFAKDAERIIDVVKKLIRLGFTVEIDDFGSGYSSLNTLKDVPAQILKLDMRFLEEGSDADRGGNVLESVIRMARWLGMSVIAEGVETKEQADLLLSVGCNYIQGFLYAKPMPVEKYEAYCIDQGKETHLLRLEMVENLDNGAFWDPASLDSLVFNSYVGAACIFEYYDRKVEVIRVNRLFTEMFGGITCVKDLQEINWLDYLNEEGQKQFILALEESQVNNKPVSGEFVLIDLPHCAHETFLRSTFRVIATAGSRWIVYCTDENITAQREAEKRESVVTQQLNSIMENVTCGISAVVVNGEKVSFLFANDHYYELFGYTKEQFEAEIGDAYDLFHPDDRQHVYETASRNNQLGCTALVESRAFRRDKSMIWIKMEFATRSFIGETNPVQISFLTDNTDEHDVLEQLRVSDEENRLAVQLSGNIVMRYDIIANTLRMDQDVANKAGLSASITDIPEGPIRAGLVSPETSESFRDFYNAIKSGGKTSMAIYQHKIGKEWHWVEAKSHTIFSDAGRPIRAVIALIEISDRIEKEAIYKKWQQSLGDRPQDSYTLFRVNLNHRSEYDTREGDLLSFDFSQSGNTSVEVARAYADRCICREDRQAYLELVNPDSLLAGYYRGIRSGMLQYRECLPDDDFRWIKLSIELVEAPSSNDVIAYMMFDDIDHSKRAELKKIELSETDPLTGIYNRKTFTAKVAQMISQRKPKQVAALFIIDLDGFKSVNDTFGHIVGDETLIEIGQKLRDTFRGQDLVSRIGGDEFMIFMSNVKHIAAIRERASLICAMLHKSFSLDVQLSSSIGIALCPEQGEDFETLYRKADMALYHVKRNGKDGYSVYEEYMLEHEETVKPEIDEKTTTSDGVRSKPKRCMLIVDDNKVNQDYLTALFDQDFLIETAEEGTAALVKLKRYGAGISIVLLDLMMPGMDGFSVLKRMRENISTQSIPVIVVSGMDERDNCLRAIRYGATDYITKPVDGELLRLRVNAALSKAENEQLRAQNRFLALQNEETRRLTEAKRHSEELATALQAAEQSDIAKTQFLSSMSHEIRTPLNAIIGYNTIAREEMAAAETEAESRQASMRVMDCLSKSDVASKHLLTIINDVLDMSAIESGKMKVEDISFDFKSLVTSLTVLFFSQARAKGVNFEVIFNKPTEEWFSGDQMRVNQVLTNLLSNAVKFTPEGGNVRLNITEVSTSADTTDFCFEVSDTGIGMTQEYLAHIWNPFEQGDLSISRRFGGSGLGLSITKNLVDLMGGTIAVESSSGVGSKFTVKLTFRRIEQPAKAYDYDFSHINALVVDDDVSACDYIKIMFDKCGVRCATFTSGDQAIDAFTAAKEHDDPFTLCLVDWRMPGKDGLSTIADIRQISHDDTPIVVVTAYDFAEVSAHAKKLGINKFISKPLFQSSLFDLLATISGAPAADATEKSPRYDFEGARVLLAEDNNMNMEVAKHILISANIAVDGAWNGQEAVDIFQASRPGTYKLILMDVHMPEVDGYEATRLIRASKHPDAQKIPIIAMTADVFAEDIVEAHNAGMNDHTAKPIDVEVLFKLLTKYMEKE